MNIYELVAHLNTTRNTELEVIPFSIQASKIYNFVFLRSKKEPDVALLTIEKLHVAHGQGVTVLSADCSICLEEILVVDLLSAVVCANAVAEKHGITKIISTNCRVADLVKIAGQIPYEWRDGAEIHRAAVKFANKFEHAGMLERHEANDARLKLIDTPE